MFHKKLSTALRNHQSTSRGLSAFQIDALYYLEQSGVFQEIKTKKTGLPECAVFIQCKRVDPKQSTLQIRRQLAHVWEMLRYGGPYDAIDVKEYEHMLQAKFITAGSLDVLATGCIEIRL